MHQSKNTRNTNCRQFVLTVWISIELGEEKLLSSLMSRSEDLSVKGKLSRALNLC